MGTISIASNAIAGSVANMLNIPGNSLCIAATALVGKPAGLKGAGDVKYTMITTIIGMWLFRITLGYLLGIVLKFGLVGVWLGMVIDWLVRSTLYYVRFKKGKWKRKTVVKISQ